MEVAPRDVAELILGVPRRLGLSGGLICEQGSTARQMGRSRGASEQAKLGVRCVDRAQKRNGGGGARGASKQAELPFDARLLTALSVAFWKPCYTTFRVSLNSASSRAGPCVPVLAELAVDCALHAQGCPPSRFAKVRKYAGNGSSWAPSPPTLYVVAVAQPPHVLGASGGSLPGHFLLEVSGRVA